MAGSYQKTLFRGLIQRPRRKLPGLVEAALNAGITETDHLIRRRQVFTNIVAYMSALNAAIHLATNISYDFNGLAVVNAYNLGMLVFCLLNHRLHAFGSLTAAITLILGIAIGHSFVVFAFGTASDLHIYFTLSGFVLILVGVENFRVFLALFGIGFIALMVSFFLAPEYGFVMNADVGLRRSLAFEAVVNAILMNGILISFVLFSLRRAEERSEDLLGAVLPGRIVDRLRSNPDRHIADRIEGCSVMFVDLVGFTRATRDLSPEDVVSYLDTLYSAFDIACMKLGGDKIKTIGDSYMAVGGLEGDAEEGARAIGKLALDCIRITDEAPSLGHEKLSLRIGLHIGPVTAGIIGDQRVSYDVWGDTVNTASRMESHGQPGKIHVSESFKVVAEQWFTFEPCGEIDIKSLGKMPTFFLEETH